MARRAGLRKWMCCSLRRDVISRVPQFLCKAKFLRPNMSHGTAPLPGGSTNGGDASVKVGFWFLALGSIGVVYGDIGTSPLYALREAVLAATGSGNPASEAVVFGILSLIIWALLLVVTAKYVLILLRADN